MFGCAAGWLGDRGRGRVASKSAVGRVARQLNPRKTKDIEPWVVLALKRCQAGPFEPLELSLGVVLGICRGRADRYPA